jgi:hypothetical protein
VAAPRNAPLRPWGRRGRVRWGWAKDQCSGRLVLNPYKKIRAWTVIDPNLSGKVVRHISLSPVPSRCRALCVGGWRPNRSAIRTLNGECTAGHDLRPIATEWTRLQRWDYVTLVHTLILCLFLNASSSPARNVPHPKSPVGNVTSSVADVNPLVIAPTVPASSHPRRFTKILYSVAAPNIKSAGRRHRRSFDRPWLTNFVHSSTNTTPA